MGYPTTAELIAASTVAALTDLTGAQQDQKAASAIDSIETFCHQTFTQEGTDAAPVTRTIDGSGSDRLYLPKRLATLAAATIDGLAMNTGLDLEVHNAESKAYVKLVSPLDAGSWVTRVRRSPGDPGPTFRSDQDNVTITGVWGWLDTEWAAGALQAVFDAILFDMEDQSLAESNQLAETVRSARALGVRSISQGGLSATIDPSEPGISTRVKRKLIPYVWQVPIGAVA